MDVLILGGGIVGLSTAYQLKKANPHYNVTLLDKESKLAQHQTGRNSGVIHAGVYYKPGSLKAKLCHAGCRAIKTFCDEHAVPYKLPGKLIVAVDEKELVRMEALKERAVHNGLEPDVLSEKELHRREPAIEGLGALFIKETGVVDYQVVCHKLAELFQALGGKILVSKKVVGITESEDHVKVTTESEQYYADYLIACCGLHSDRIAKMCGLDVPYSFIPFRGEYYKLSDKHTYHHLIYPVPDPELPFLGVHFTLHVDGYWTVGPNAVLALSREGYRLRDINLSDSFEVLRTPALWKMVRRHLSVTQQEVLTSLFKGNYLKLLHKYQKNLKKSDLFPYPSGVRSQAIDASGKLVDDFLFAQSKRTLHTLNAPSPAATSCLPIGAYILEKSGLMQPASCTLNAL